MYICIYVYIYIIIYNNCHLPSLAQECHLLLRMLNALDSALGTHPNSHSGQISFWLLLGTLQGIDISIVNGSYFSRPSFAVSEASAPDCRYVTSGWLH